MTAQSERFIQSQSRGASLLAKVKAMIAAKQAQRRERRQFEALVRQLKLLDGHALKDIGIDQERLFALRPTVVIHDTRD